MKRAIVGLTVLMLGGAAVPTVWAGGWGWSVSGGLVLGSAPAPRPVCYAAPVPVYYTVPAYGYHYAAPARATVVYVAPAPVVVYRPPVYVTRPVVSRGFGYCGYRRGCW